MSRAVDGKSACRLAASALIICPHLLQLPRPEAPVGVTLLGCVSREHTAGAVDFVLNDRRVGLAR